MSPELINGQPYDIKSDVWALGCLIYEICAGQYVLTLVLSVAADETLQSAISRGSNATGTRRAHSRGQNSRPTETVHTSFRSGGPSNAQTKCLSSIARVSMSNFANQGYHVAAEASSQHFADQSSRQRQAADSRDRTSKSVSFLIISSSSR